MFVFDRLPIKHIWGLGAAAGLGIPLVTGAALGHWFFDRYPFAFILNNLLLAVALGVVVFHCYDRAFLWLTLWYYAVGIGTLVFLYFARDPVSRGILQWEQAPFWFLGLIFFYALGVYGGLKPQLGGDAPVPAVIYVSPKAPIFSSESTEILLSDETDAGYYLLLQSDQKSAYFIRREIVTALRFKVK